MNWWKFFTLPTFLISSAASKDVEPFQFLFLNPPRGSDDVSSPLNLGSVPVNISWITVVSNYTIFLQPSAADNIPLYSKKTDDAETGVFMWNIASTNISNPTGSSFELLAITSPSTFLDLTRSFNISREAIAAPGPRPASQSLLSTITSSHSTGINRGSAFSTTLLSSTTKLAFSTMYPPIFTTSATPDTTVKSSSINEKPYIDIGVGLGVPLILLLSLAFWFRHYRKRPKNCKTKQSQSLSSDITLSANDSDNTFDVITNRAELPTSFNVVRSMKATLIGKFELPGRDNELPNPEGPYELSAD